MDTYTPFGCSSYDPPEPLDPINICKKCSDKLKHDFLNRFRNEEYKYGDWQKSKAERDAAKECGLVWVNGAQNVEYNGHRAFFEYVPKKVFNRSAG